MMKKLNHQWVNLFKFNYSNRYKIRNKDHPQLSITINKIKQKTSKRLKKFIYKTKIFNKKINQV